MLFGNNNNNRMNMTTLDFDFGASINQIYKQKLDQRSASETLLRNKSKKYDSISNQLKPDMNEVSKNCKENDINQPPKQH